MSELKWNLENFLESNLFTLITISMNLFDQLVIVICDLVMEGSAPSRKKFGVLMIVCCIKFYFGYENWIDLIGTALVMS